MPLPEDSGAPSPAEAFEDRTTDGAAGSSDAADRSSDTTDHPADAPAPSPDTLRSRTRKSGDERRREIVEATLEILTREGLHAWTTSALAARVGVSEATIFRHFDTKEHILEAAVRQTAEGVRARVAAYEPEGTTWENIRGLVLHALDHMEASGGGPILILVGLAGDLPRELREQLGASRRLLRGRIAAMRNDDGTVPEWVPDETLADLAMAVAQSSSLRWLLEGRVRSLRGIAEPMLDALGRAFAEGAA